MPSISEILQSKAVIKQARTEDMKAERDKLSAMRNEALGAVTQNPGLYEQYLVLQAKNMGLSAGNIALAMLQLPEPTKLGTTDFWHDQGRYVIDRELEKGANVFVPPRDPNKRGYFMGKYYDVSQTDGRPMRETPPLEDGSERMDAAFAALVDTSPVECVENNKLNAAARYNEHECVIEINSEKSTSEVFAALAAEIVYARDHDRGYNRDYDRSDLKLNAESIAFMVCYRFGVEHPLPDAKEAPAYYSFYEPEDCGKELDSLRQAARNMGDSVERAITPRQQERGNNRTYNQAGNRAGNRAGNQRSGNRRQYGGR